MPVELESFMAPADLARRVSGAPVFTYVDESAQPWKYRDNRRDASPLILLPGALGNGDTAWRISRALDHAHRVVSVTYPGDLSADGLATGLHSLLRSIGVGSAAIWGSSYGAWWAQAYARHFPENVSALWLGNAFVDGTDVARSPLFESAWLDAASDVEVVERWNEALLMRPDDPLRRVQLYMLHHGLDAFAFHCRLKRVAAASPLPPAGSIANLVVCDCADDPVLQEATRNRFAARYPTARRLTLPSGGHYPHLTNVGALLPELGRWLGG